MNLKQLGLGCLMVWWFCMTASGSMPLLFPFEGEYYTNGYPSNESINLRLQLYDEPTGGNFLYEDSNSVVQVTNGYYRTFIGDDPATGSGPLATALVGGEVYVQVIINGSNSPNREFLAPMPYALSAATVASAGDIVVGSLSTTGAVSASAMVLGNTTLDDEYLGWNGSPLINLTENSLVGGWMAGSLASTGTITAAKFEGSAYPDLEEAIAGKLDVSGDSMAGVLDLGQFNMTNAIGIYGPTTTNASNLTIMAGSRIGGGGYGGTLFLLGGGNGYSGYGGVVINPFLIVTNIFAPSGAGSSSGSNLTIHAGDAHYTASTTGGVLRLSGGAGLYGASPGWIRLESRVDANGNTLSNASFVGDGSGITNLPVTGLTTNTADERYVNAAGDTLAGNLDLGRYSMTNAIGIYGPTTTNASNLTIMAGSRIGGGSAGGTLYLSGGWDGVSGYGSVVIRAPLLTAELRPVDNYGGDGSNLLIRAGAGYYSGHTGGVLRLAGGAGQSGATSGWIRLESRVDANGQTISNALFIGNGAGLTNLPVTGLTTNSADARYVQKTGGTIAGAVSNLAWVYVGNESLSAGDPGRLWLRNNDAGRWNQIFFDSYGFAVADEADSPFYLTDLDGNIGLDRLTNSLESGAARYVGDGSGLTNLPVTGLTTNDADSRYVNTAGDAIAGPIELGVSNSQTNLTVTGWAMIDYIPPQGGISMGVYTNR